MAGFHTRIVCNQRIKGDKSCLENAVKAPPSSSTFSWQEPIGRQFPEPIGRQFPVPIGGPVY